MAAAGCRAVDCSPVHGRLWRAAPLRAVLHRPCFTAHASPPVRGVLQGVQNSASRHVLHVKSLFRVPSGHTIRAALRAALEKCYNASSPKSWFSPELEPIQVKTTSTLMILGSGPLCPSLGELSPAATRDTLLLPHPHGRRTGENCLSKLRRVVLGGGALYPPSDRSGFEVSKEA